VVIKPERLRPGDTVGLVTPASPVLDLRDIAHARRALEELGFRVRHGKYLRRRYGFLAGTDQERADDLNGMFADPDIRGIFATRGGYGSARVLQYLDWDTVAANPKVLIGHSDLTALLTAVHQRTGLVTFWGPLAGYDLGRHPSKFKARWLMRILCEPSPTLRFPRGVDNGRARRWRNISSAASASAPLTGGNLSLLASLTGTPWEVSTEGRLLFIEDVDEEPYRMDRLLGQLKMSDKLQRAAGIVVGRCIGCEGTGRMKRTFSLRQVLEQRLAGLGLPVIYGAPIGHEPDKITLPLGVRACLDTSASSLTLLEPAVL